MHTVEAIVKGYLDAIIFTETGEGDQPSADAKISDSTKLQAWKDCRNFYNAYSEEYGFENIDPEQIGHDIWMTRNGHGVGFWCRPEIYGIGGANILTCMAKAIGSHDAEFELEEECTD